MATTHQTLLASLQSAKLLPTEVIQTGFIPTISLTLSFGQKAVTHGNLLRVSDVKSEPTISFSGEAGKKYTLILVDPDAPTPADPKFAWWRHWIVSGISSYPEEDATAINAPPAITPYLAPGVKDESGPHRYTFLLYEQPEGVEVSRDHVPGDEFVERRSFDVARWAAGLGLRLVGVDWFTGVGDGWVGEDQQ